MNDSKSRKSVKKFFHFKLNQDGLKWKPVRIKFALISVIAGSTGGLIHDLFNSSWPNSTILWFILSFALSVGADRGMAWIDIALRRSKKKRNNLEFAELAHVVQRVQADDLKKSTLRVFERCQLDRSELRVLQNQYNDQASGLLDIETPDKILGDIRNKSCTFRSLPNQSGGVIRWVRWIDANRTDAFFNPVRIVSLYLTNTQIVVCDVIVDSIKGDLQEDILRIAFSDVVGITSTNVRKRKELTFADEDEKRIALDHGFSEEDIQEMRRKSLKDEGDAWCLETIISELKISRTDGGLQALPVRFKTSFGVGKSALDGDALTADEIAIDRMVNELNRMIEGSKLTTAGR
ncbi:hypothetical protein ACFJIW_16255 [Tahibacter sp. UC22_41]|uniref:hypothetical protein n=1 Tax=Tahibacter sp. UC22_41 TaxID=3350178 RepID=UPI0036DCBA51